MIFLKTIVMILSLASYKHQRTWNEGKADRQCKTRCI